MKKCYEDYHLEQGSYFSSMTMEPIFRDILAELEQLNKHVDYLEAAVDSLITLPKPYQVAGDPASTNASTNQSIAKMEAARDKP